LNFPKHRRDLRVSGSSILLRRVATQKRIAKLSPHYYYYDIEIFNDFSIFHSIGSAVELRIKRDIVRCTHLSPGCGCGNGPSTTIKMKPSEKHRFDFTVLGNVVSKRLRKSTIALCTDPAAGSSLPRNDNVSIECRTVTPQVP
jgi:hypothetical protein